MSLSESLLLFKDSAEGLLLLCETGKIFVFFSTSFLILETTDFEFIETLLLESTTSFMLKKVAGIM